MRWHRSDFRYFMKVATASAMQAVPRFQTARCIQLHELHKALQLAIANSYVWPLIRRLRAGLLPAPRKVELPPGDWLQQLRVPPCDEVLAQYHRLKSGTANPTPAPAAPAQSHFPSENDPPPGTIAAVHSHPLEEHTSRFSLPRGSLTAGHKQSLHVQEGG